MTHTHKLQIKKWYKVNNNTEVELEKVKKDLEEAVKCQQMRKTEIIEFKYEGKRKEKELTSQKGIILQLNRIGRSPSQENYGRENEKENEEMHMTTGRRRGQLHAHGHRPLLC